MTRRVVVVIVVLLLIAGLGAILDRNGAVVGRVAGDAMFEGYPTRSWARRLGLGPADKATALSALERGGPQAVPVLIEILTGSRGTEGANLRYSAVEVLGKLGADAVSAGPALLKAVEDDDPHVRAVAAAALPRVETPAELAVPALTKLLASNHSVVAARALSVYRAQAASALPELEALLRDRNRETEVRWYAARTIGKIGPAALGSVPALIEHFSDREASIREHVAEAIGDIGPSAAEVGVPPLIPLLQD
ncbi:MAG: HEAT repeat domain-containing protein, partial [Planctomycetaceae bacterium]